MREKIKNSNPSQKGRSYPRFHPHWLLARSPLGTVNAGIRTGILTEAFRSQFEGGASIVLPYYYSFSNISYNFLPQTLYEAIDRGMGMERERKALHQHVEQVEQMRNQVSERKLNRVIVLLTFLTLASTLYDGTSLLTEAGGIEAGSCWYRAIAVGLTLVALGLILYIIYHNRHRKV